MDIIFNQRKINIELITTNIQCWIFSIWLTPCLIHNMVYCNPMMTCLTFFFPPEVENLMSQNC